MTDEELIARLRLGVPTVWEKQAADRLEALVKERDDAVIKRAAWELEAKTQKARAERLEAALRTIGGNNCITFSAEAFNALFAKRHPSSLKGDDHE